MRRRLVVTPRSPNRRVPILVQVLIPIPRRFIKFRLGSDLILVFLPERLKLGDPVDKDHYSVNPLGNPPQGLDHAVGNLLAEHVLFGGVAVFREEVHGKGIQTDESDPLLLSELLQPFTVEQEDIARWG